MTLVVVSNRVARAKPNEPMTGGLAAALLPVVEKSGAIWVGSSGRVRDGQQREPFAQIESLGRGALALLSLAVMGDLVLLNYHWLSDVIAGALFGFTAALLVLALQLPRHLHPPSR